MSIIIDKVTICNPEGKFTDEIKFDIEYECLKILKHPITWKVIYFASAENHDYDQLIRKVDVGPSEIGISRFVLAAKPPKVDLIPFDEFPLAMLNLSAYYEEQEFFRICYFISNDIDPSATSFEGVDLSTIQRTIDAEQPTIHTLQINWQ